jgi:superfamily II DNA/RNA helicase
MSRYLGSFCLTIIFCKCKSGCEEVVDVGKQDFSARELVGTVPYESSFTARAKTPTSNRSKILKKFRNNCVSL